MAQHDRTRTDPSLPRAEWLMGVEDEIVDFTALRKKPKTDGPGKTVPPSRSQGTQAKPHADPSPWVADFLLNQFAGAHTDIRPRGTPRAPSANVSGSGEVAEEKSGHQLRQSSAAAPAHHPDRRTERTMETPRSPKPALVGPKPTPVAIGAKHSRLIGGRHPLLAVLSAAILVGLYGLYGLSGGVPQKLATAGIGVPTKQARDDPGGREPWLDLPTAVAEVLPPAMPVQFAAATLADAIPPSVTDALSAEHLDVTPSIDPVSAKPVGEPIAAPPVPPPIRLAALEPPPEPAGSRRFAASTPLAAPVLGAPKRTARIDTAPVAIGSLRQPAVQVTAGDAGITLAARGTGSADAAPADLQAMSPKGPDTAERTTAPTPLPAHVELRRAAPRSPAHATRKPPAPRVAQTGQWRGFALPFILRPTSF